MRHDDIGNYRFPDVWRWMLTYCFLQLLFPSSAQLIRKWIKIEHPYSISFTFKKRYLKWKILSLKLDRTWVSFFKLSVYVDGSSTYYFYSLFFLFFPTWSFFYVLEREQEHIFFLLLFLLLLLLPSPLLSFFFFLYAGWKERDGTDRYTGQPNFMCIYCVLFVYFRDR